MVNNFIKLRGVRRKEIDPKNSLLMSRDNTALIVMDIQEKLIKAIPNRNELTWNTKKLIDGFKILNMGVYITEQNPDKLGESTEIINNIDAYPKFEKMDFSCSNCIGLSKEFKRNNIKNILFCGIETHICILQSAMDFINKGHKVFIAADCTGSRNKIDHDTAIKRLEGAGATISTSEAAIFELCRTALAKEFKDISALIKRERSNS